jgi:Alpha/beta hydrolase domain
MLIVLLLSLVLFPKASSAEITKIVIDKREPFANGYEFPGTGAYEKLVGKAYGEIDPKNPVNKVIINLDKAPRNAQGRVEYDADFYILRPLDLTKGNRKILFEVTNRGRKFLMPRLHDAAETAPGAANDPATLNDVGNALAFRMGYTLVWSGWDPDAPRTNNGMVIRVPVATVGDAPIIKTIRDEFVFGTRVPVTRLTAPLSYEAATLEQRQARLTVRRKEADTADEIPASGWAYVDSHSIKLLPEGAKFQPGLIYDFSYPAKNPTILGIGFAATRDLVSFLRYAVRDSVGSANPIAVGKESPGIKTALAIGVSQSGRYLRDHIQSGFNQDESKRKVFDGVLAHTAGIGKVFANFEFGQPNRTNTQHEDHHFPENQFPFAHTKLTDPLTGKSGALLRGDGFDPLVMEVNTSTEYWQKGASLLHTDPLGTRDIAIPNSVRVYMIAGTKHGGQTGLNPTNGNCLNPRNPHNPWPALRALLVALDKWVTDGVEPPASRVPTLGSGSLVKPEQFGFPPIPGVQAPRATNHIELFGDWANPQPLPRKAYTTLVAKVDGDGNEVAGIRLPGIAVPVATYTGWNFYKSPYPEGELCDREGIYAAFARTKAERDAKGDPRLSVEERYKDQVDYVQQVSRAARTLVDERFLLPEDADRIISESKKQPLFGDGKVQ